MEDNNVLKSRRFIELDSLRGLAALAVFFSHAIGMINVQDRFYGKLIDKTILHFFWDGSAAVILFFVLSGFVLALPYVGDNGKSMDFLPFIIRRIFRIYPAYYAALGISLFLKFYVFKMGGLEGLSAFITQFWNWPNEQLTLNSLIKHFIMIGPKFDMGQIDSIIWSLVVEMQVSLLFPFIIPIIKRVNTFWGGASLFLLSIALYETVKIDIVSYIPLFVLGGLLARFRKKLIDWFQKLSTMDTFLIGAGGMMLYTSRFSMRWIDINYTRTNYVIGLGVAVLILIVISKVKVAKILQVAPLKYLGDVSYSFYLLHFPILLTVASLLYSNSGSIKLSWAVSLIVSLVLPYFTYKWIEMPFQKVGKYLSKKVEVIISLERVKIKEFDT